MQKFRDSKRLSDLGVKENQLKLISEMAVVDPTA